MHRLATWCFNHRRTVLALWLGLLVSLLLANAGTGSNFSNATNLPNTESTRAVKLLERASPQISGDVEQIVIATTNGARVTDPAVRSVVEGVLGRLASIEGVTTIESPYGVKGAGQINAANTTAFAQVIFNTKADSLPKGLPKQFVATARSGNNNNIQIEASGRIATLSEGMSIGGTAPGILLAGVVLFFVFGSVFAMALPLLSAAIALGTAMAVVGMLSNVINMPVFAPELVLLVGLGVGIDYALFIVTRHRQGLIAGKSVKDSAVTATNTSGRAVLFAGIIVCIALLGMFALGVAFLYGLAIAAAIGVLFTMLAALTLIPAMLGFIGHRVMSRKQRTYLEEHGPRVVGSSGFWKRWATSVMDRPKRSAFAAITVIVILAIPIFGMRLGASDDSNAKKGSTTRAAYDLMAKGFGPGFVSPLQVVGVVHTVKERAAFGSAVQRLSNTPGVAAVSPPIFIPNGRSSVAFANVYATTSSQDRRTTQLINHLRRDVIPEALRTSTLDLYVGGTTAVFHDFTEVLGAKLPLFIGLVVGMSFLLLVVVFRSIVVPLTAAFMNLLSAGAAFGMLVAVFQWGWLSTIFGANPGPIDPFVPVMMFAILFGLSMDYEVFLISRIHEEWVNSGDNRVAVRNGLATTGKTISAAALIMILVFGSFMLGGERVITEFGFGLAGGIAVDAIVIRGAVIPAVMQILGKANWWLPAWLERLVPVVHVEGTEDSEDELQAHAAPHPA